MKNEKEFLQGYRGFIYFCVITLFQVWYSILGNGEDTLPIYIAAASIWLGVNKVDKVISKPGSKVAPDPKTED